MWPGLITSLIKTKESLIEFEYTNKKIMEMKIKFSNTLNTWDSQEFMIRQKLNYRCTYSKWLILILLDHLPIITMWVDMNTFLVEY